MRILIVEDEMLVRGSCGRALRSRGFQVDTAASLREARSKLTLHSFAAVLLDRGLPDGDGLDLVRHLRARGDAVPVLIFSAHTTDDDIMESLDAGADGYVLKPVAPDVLAARLSALVRRARSSTSYTVGNLFVDATAREVSLQSGAATTPPSDHAHLTDVETLFLVELAKRPDETVTREELLDVCYGDDPQVNDNALDAIASRIRRKLGRYAERIETVRGRGFLLRSSIRCGFPTNATTMSRSAAASSQTSEWLAATTWPPVCWAASVSTS